MFHADVSNIAKNTKINTQYHTENTKHSQNAAETTFRTLEYRQKHRYWREKPRFCPKFAIFPTSGPTGAEEGPHSDFSIGTLDKVKIFRFTDDVPIFFSGVILRVYAKI